MVVFFTNKDVGGSANELGTRIIVLLAGASGTVVSGTLVVVDVSTRFFDCAESGDHFHLHLDWHFRR